MKSTIAITICLLLSLVLFAPGETSAQTSDILTTDVLNSISTSTGLNYTQFNRRVKGTPYLNKDWKRGHVILKDDTRSEQVLLRLNTYKPAVEFSRGVDETIYVIPPDNLKGMVIYSDFGDILFRNGYSAEEEDITPSTMLRVIHEGKTKLLAHHKTVLQEDIPTYGVASQVDEFIVSDSYYLVTPDGTFNEIRLRKRDIMRQLGEHADAVERYSRQNNLDFGEETEAAVLLQYYDSLIAENESGDSGN